jgi:hypothetical protein
MQVGDSGRLRRALPGMPIAADRRLKIIRHLGYRFHDRISERIDGFNPLPSEL